MQLSIAEAINIAKLSLVESDSAKLDAEILLLNVLQCDNRAYLLTWPEKKLTVEQQAQFEQLILRRIQGEPVAYITGIKEFWGLTLRVDNSTLIPRPDTETIVELALDKIQLQAWNNGSLLDLGTGTGAIALALKSELSDWRVDAVEFNPSAVELAKKNSQLNNLAIQVLAGSWFEPIPSQQKYNLITSNPPYIRDLDPHLSQGDVRFEPKSALTSGNDGLDDIRLIIAHAKTYLITDGWILIEHGFDQGADVRAIFEQFGYVNCETEQDLSGQDRITLAQWST